MKERGILFSAPMVRKLLAGEKTQTRRVVKVGNHFRAMLHGVEGGVATFGDSIPDDPVPLELRCPYGPPGDRLWVRETWQAIHVSIDPETGYGDDVLHAEEIPKSDCNGYWGVAFAADPNEPTCAEDRGFPWRPAIHMPRWASRITLEIADVRVERLQSISTMDAMAEGVAPLAVAGGALSYTHGFRVLWDSINGARDGYSWDANPWVWAISFARVTP